MCVALVIRNINPNCDKKSELIVVAVPQDAHTGSFELPAALMETQASLNAMQWVPRAIIQHSNVICVEHATHSTNDMIYHAHHALDEAG